jgi:predicted PurR-regulated permease PerM
MLGIDPKAARYVWTAAAVVLLLFLIYLTRRTLFIFILAVLLAYLISPLVNLLDRYLPTRTRTPALGLSYIIFIGILVLLGFEVGTTVMRQAKALEEKLPAMTAKWEAPSPNAPALWNSLKAETVRRIRSDLFSANSNLLTAATSAGLKFVTIASDAIYVVIIPILAFFFLKDGHAMRRHILDLVDAGPNRALVDDLMADIHLLLAHYMRALVLLSLAAFTVFSIGFSIIGVPYGVLLAALAGLLEFIPMIGPLTAALIIVGVSLLSGSNVLAVLIFLLAYRVFQDYILSPHLMGQGVEVHPLLVLFGVFAGAEIAGIPGTFLSVPVLALIRIFYLRIRKARLGTPSAAPEPVER